MNDTSLLARLAKSVQYQNLFTSAKEINGIYLFENHTNLSKVQDIFLSYLYTFDTINRDIVVDNISKVVLKEDTDIYWQAYMMWKRNKGTKETKKENSERYMSLVPAKKIKFTKEEK